MLTPKNGLFYLADNISITLSDRIHRTDMVEIICPWTKYWQILSKGSVGLHLKLTNTDLRVIDNPAAHASDA